MEATRVRSGSKEEILPSHCRSELTERREENFVSWREDGREAEWSLGPRSEGQTLTAGS